MKGFNINLNVYVKLTNRGMDIWRTYFNQVDSPTYTFENHRDNYETDGFHHFQMHELMLIFGSYMDVGSKNIFENNMIFFNETNLR